LGIAIQINVTFDHGVDLYLGVGDGKNKVVTHVTHSGRCTPDRC
jgi:hypothetical protein